MNEPLVFRVPEPPPDRGRFLTAAQVAADVLNGAVSPAWVRRRLPYKVRLGHSTVGWIEADVKAYLERCRAST
jgi:hypothetical protein